MRLVRTAVLITSFAILFGGAASSAMAGAFCDSSLSNSKMWAGFAQICPPKATNYSEYKSEYKLAAGCSPQLPNPCCCSMGKSGQVANCTDPKYSKLPKCESNS